MRLGEFRNLVSLERKNIFNGELGENRIELEPYAQVFAVIKPINTNDKQEAKKEIGVVTHKIEIRYRCDVKVWDIVRFKERIFEITSIINVYERNKKLILTAVELER